MFVTLLTRLQIGFLTSLTTLNFGNNKLQAIPSQLSNLVVLQSLYV